MSASESSDTPEADNSSANSNKRKGPNKFLVFSGMAVQMGGTIGLGAWGGQQLDVRYQSEKPYWTIFFSLLGVFISLYLLIKQAKKLSDDI